MIASKLICFEEVDVSTLKLLEKKSKEEKGREHTANIVNNTKVLDPVQVSCYLPGTRGNKNDNLDDNLDDRFGSVSCIRQHLGKRNQRQDEGNQWRVLMPGGKELLVSQQELLDKKKFLVKHAFQSKTPQQQHKEAQQTKQQRQQEHKEKEVDMEATARERRKELDTREYQEMMKKIQGKDNFTLDDFFELAKQLQTPFQTKVDDIVVTVAKDDCAIMMKTSPLEAIATTVLVKKRLTDKCERGNVPNK